MTVVVPCYNYGHFLEECVRSIVSQPGVETDVLIVDDASPDGSAAVAHELAERIPQVRVDAHEVNRGHIATYNGALATVDSDYVVLLSADDLLAPGALGRATAVMEENPTVGLTYGNPQLFAEHPVVRSTRHHSSSVWSGERWIEWQFRRGLSLIYSAEAVVRTSVHHTAGYYRPELPHSGDLEMWLRIAAISDVGRVNGPDQAYRRDHPASMMRTHYATVVKDLVRRDEAYESFLATAGSDLPDADQLRIVVRRRMSHEALEWAVGALGHVPPEEIEEAVDFATSLTPGYRSLRVWREFEAATGARQSTVGARYDAWARDISNRFHWRRWRYFGV